MNSSPRLSCATLHCSERRGKPQQALDCERGFECHCDLVERAVNALRVVLAGAACAERARYALRKQARRTVRAHDSPRCGRRAIRHRRPCRRRSGSSVGTRRVHSSRRDAFRIPRFARPLPARCRIRRAASSVRSLSSERRADRDRGHDVAAPFDLLRVLDELAEHLIAGADAEDVPAAANVGLKSMCQPCVREELEIGDRRFAAGQNDEVRIERQRPTRRDEFELAPPARAATDRSRRSSRCAGVAAPRSHRPLAHPRMRSGLRLFQLHRHLPPAALQPRCSHGTTPNRASRCALRWCREPASNSSQVAAKLVDDEAANRSRSAHRALHVRRPATRSRDRDRCRRPARPARRPHARIPCWQCRARAGSFPPGCPHLRR